MSDRTELIARLEKATGPDRELDEAIVKALYPESIVAIYCVGDEEPTVFHAEPLVRNKRELPHFTSSLDAAMTLVPADCEWEAGSAKLIDAHWARLVSAAEEYKAKSTTAPLALCIAALKAQKTQSNG